MELHFSAIEVRFELYLFIERCIKTIFTNQGCFNLSKLPQSGFAGFHKFDSPGLNLLT